MYRLYRFAHGIGSQEVGDNYGRDDSTQCVNSGEHGKCVDGFWDAQAYD